MKTLVMASLVAGAPVALAAQESGGQLTAGLSWSSLHGAVGSLGLEARDIGGSGLDASLEGRKGEQGSGGRLRLRYSRALGVSALGQNPRLVASLSGAASDWQSSAYSSDSLRASVGLATEIAPDLTVTGQMFWQRDNAYDLRVNASPLIAAALGRSTAAGLSLGLSLDRLENAPLPRSGYALGGELVWAGMGERKYSAVSISGSYAHPIGANTSLSFKGEAGVARGLEGQAVSIYDRAFLGGSFPRGFEVGGVGPRDYVSGSVDTALGGNRYVGASIEARHMLSDRVTLGVFADAGSVWELDGAPVGAMGPIDASKHMRSSAGVAVYVTTGMGTLSLNLARPIAKQPNDPINEVSFGLVSSF